MSTHRLLNPRSIAIYGASERPDGVSERIIRSLEVLGYPGEVFLVNPRYERILGHKTFQSLDDLPRGIDVVAFCVGRSRVLEAFRDLPGRDVGAAVVYAGGFAESGPEGRAAQNELAEIARTKDIAVCGPNGMGVMNLHAKMTCYMLNLREPANLVGNVGLITHSGSIVNCLLVDSRRFGFSSVISCGNEAVTTVAELIEELVEDPQTRIIAACLEKVTDAGRFATALDKAAANEKPVVVLRTGRSAKARQAILAHTGSLAGEARLFSEVLARHRAIEVPTIDAMAEMLAAFQGRRQPQGRRIGLISESGGFCELIHDCAEENDIVLPAPTATTAERVDAVVTDPISSMQNPIDVWGTGGFAGPLSEIIGAYGTDPNFDSIAVAISDTRDGQATRPYDSLQSIIEGAGRLEKPVFVLHSRSGQHRREEVEQIHKIGIPIVGGFIEGLRAIDRVGKWGADRSSRYRKHRDIPALNERLSSDSNRKTINEYDAKKLLALAGLPVISERKVIDLDEALRAAHDFGFPVVLKMLSDAIVHKTEHGLVAVNIETDAQLKDSWHQMSDKLAGLDIERGQAFGLLQPMIKGGTEMFAGIARDPEFGLYIAAGLGGVLIETIKDIALRPLPLVDGDAESMLSETIAGRVFSGVRGGPPLDNEAFYDCVYRLADFALTAEPMIQEIDLNPIIVRENGLGCTIVDALIVPRHNS